jgi:calcineurin-like phosphoesterase family protein
LTQGAGDKGIASLRLKKGLMAEELFVSDTHFGHSNIIKYTNRPFPNAKVMDEALITNWNSVVKPNDIVRHIGDFGCGRGVELNYLESILDRLNGKIHFYEGNHDKLARKLRHRFASYQKFDEIEVQGQKIVVCHYALRTWHHDARGVWHVFGHSHGLLPPHGKSVDVGVDSKWFKPFTPIPFTTLKEFMDKRPVSTDNPRFKNYDPIKDKE